MSVTEKVEEKIASKFSTDQTEICERYMLFGEVG